jgi:hypothetical protein
VVAESGVSTTAIDWQIPLRNSDGRRVIRESEVGWLHLKVWDDVDRAEAVGEKTYVDAWIPLDLTEDDSITEPTGLSVAQLAPGDPRHIWQWQRTEAADAWLIEIDGDTAERLEPEDVSLSGGIYSWTDNGHISPLRTHRLKVRALDGIGKSVSNAIEMSSVVEGVWWFPEDGSDPIVFEGTGVGGWTREDRMATYTPLKGEEIDIIYDRPGRVVTFEGTVDAFRGEDVWEKIAAVETLRRSRNRKGRLIWGSHSAYGRLRSPDVTASDEITPANLEHVVRFGFVQKDED